MSRRGGPKGWVLPPQAHLGPHRRLLRGLTRGTMSTYLPAAPWTFELSPEQGGALQEGPSFHQPPYAHPVFSSQKTPQQAPGSRASPDLASATGDGALESCPLAGAPTAVCVSFHASDLCFFPTPTPFARALLEPWCPSVDCVPQRPLPAPRCVTLPWAPVLGAVGHSFPASDPGALCPHFLEKIQGRRWAACPGPSLQAE